MKILDLPWMIAHRRQIELFDDFEAYSSTNGLWTTKNTAVGGESTAASTTLLDGQLTLTTGGTQANQAGFYSTGKIFKLSSTRGGMFFECALQYVDANNHDAGLFLGFNDGLVNTGATSPLITNGTLPKASQTAIGFYKLSAGTNWLVYSQATTTILNNTTTIAADDASGSVFHTFRIEVQPISATQADVMFYIDGVQCVDNTSKLPIKHTFTFNATAMYTGVSCVAGGANSQTPNVDYVCAVQQGRPTIA